MDKVALLSLASDLKRITQSIQRNANGNAEKFTREAQKWLEEAKKSNCQSFESLLDKISKVLKKENNLQKAEDCLMYSVLLQNRAISQK